MTTTAAQQVAIDNALVPLEKRVKIGKYNMRIDPTKTQKEPSYQVVLDALALTTYYPIFLITADVLKIYMHQFWFTINKKDSTVTNGDIVSFIKELGHNGDIKSMTEEDFIFQIENIDHKNQEKVYYPRFTKAIIHHFITKDKSILMRNRMFMHTAQDDSILGTVRFVSKSKDFQIYGELLPNMMTNQQMMDSNAYKTYLAYATRASPKMKRKFKKLASPSKKKTLVTVEEEEPEPAKKVVPTKKPATKRQSFGEEYERINEELYGDVNVIFTNDEPADKEKDDVENTVAGHVNVNQEGACNQVKDDAQDTQKVDAPIPSSSISSDYAPKFLNFDNIPPTDSEIVSMMDINIQHEVLHTSSLLIILVSVIPKQDVINQSETIITKATTSTTVVLDFKTITALHQRIANFEKDVKELKDVDNSTKVISTIQSKVLKDIKEYLRSSLDNAMHKKSVKDIQEIKKEHARKQHVPKSFNKSLKQRALYHALVESILKDEDAIDDGVADKLKKRKSNDADKDEGPSAGSDRGLKTQKTSKHTKPSKSTETSKGTSKSQPKSAGKSAQAEETVFEAGNTQGP
nr:hypothetical protein [Tanacetum cinerariifolium]